MTHWEHLGYRPDPAGDAARREAMASATVTAAELLALRAEEERSVGSPPPGQDAPVAGHLLSYYPGKTGTQVICQCGRWDGWFNGARSRRRILDDHAEHCAAELRAVAPLRVQAVRLDTEREEPP